MTPITVMVPDWVARMLPKVDARLEYVVTYHIDAVNCDLRAKSKFYTRAKDAREAVQNFRQHGSPAARDYWAVIDEVYPVEDEALA